MTTHRFNFDGMGIGELIRRNRLVVPPNQRPYAWEESHVTDLLQDLNAAIQQDDKEEYFLGTIVLIHAGAGSPQIADGQQRVATTSIVLARARDMLLGLKREQRARAIDEQFIQRIDMETEEVVPHLQLNDEDNDFYKTKVLSTMLDGPARAEAGKSVVRPSNKRLLQASDIAQQFLQNYLKSFREDMHADQILRWVKFIQERASVVVVTVPDEVGAFRMFETLNDRGLRASQADILKNYLFSKTTPQRVHEAHMQWNAMSGSISTLADDEDDNLVRYLRYFWITKNGLTREKELADSIKKNISNESKAMQFLTDARAASSDFVALWSQTHTKWSTYRSTTRQHLYTLNAHMKVEQIVPLLFAVAIHFDPEEADKAFKLFVSWSVRFLIGGGGRGGRLDKQYSERAQSVGNGTITKARELRDSMRHFVPTNKEFEEAFAVARVSKTYLARYYLRALDKALKNDPTPEYVANEDEKQINLEHIMPLTVGPDWSVDPEQAEANQKLLGNMVLLSAQKNVSIGNASFSVKKKAYQASSYHITSQVCHYERWGSDEIRERQAEMAKIAVRTWALDFA